MMRTKATFKIMILLCLFFFPYHIAVLCINSDFSSSIIPGWHTTIIPGQILSNSIKFLALIATVICSWKLYKIQNQIALKSFAIYLLFTIPVLFIGRISLYELISFSSEDIINRIRVVVFINICLNILFFIGQIYFWRVYILSKRSSEINNLT
ncbi:hypothetical protein HYN56_14480 [Flavobacterium crocinum]|uniref:DUF2569 domain-containing protein n=1 Tax=Flavobacterium crocinum TaxID=2183896 RepID=A0A2S1YMS8_9FLAO|nr:hypothetical protein HYN56_14480 [Flavobacterium crocinum]